MEMHFTSPSRLWRYYYLCTWMRRKSSLLPCSIQSSCLPQVQQRNLSGLTQDHFLLMQSYWWSLQPSRTAVLHIQGLAFQAAVKLCLLHCAQCRDGSEESINEYWLIYVIDHSEVSPRVLTMWSTLCCKLSTKETGGPVGKTPCFQCSRCRFDPWSGN